MISVVLTSDAYVAAVQANSDQDTTDSENVSVECTVAPVSSNGAKNVLDKCDNT